MLQAVHFVQVSTPDGTILLSNGIGTFNDAENTLAGCGPFVSSLPVVNENDYIIQFTAGKNHEKHNYSGCTCLSGSGPLFSFALGTSDSTGE